MTSWKNETYCRRGVSTRRVQPRDAALVIIRTWEKREGDGMEIVLSSASHHAMLFVYVAKEIIDGFGERGRDVIVRAVRRYGRQRGRRMAMRARIDQNPCNALYYDMYGEWECFPGQVECTPGIGGEGFSLHYNRCPWYTEWRHFDMMEYGRYYCDYVDAAIMEGFGLTSGSLTGSRADGDLTCDLTFFNEHYSRADYDRLEEDRRLLGRNGKMPWEYHVGHLYQCLKRCIEKQLGEEGLAALETGLVRYGEQFGEDARQLVLEYGEIDYEMLPPYKSYKMPKED